MNGRRRTAANVASGRSSRSAAAMIRMLWHVCCLAVAAAAPALAGKPRDIVFDCPCRAEWTAGPGEAGQLTVQFGVRSHRATESGEIRLVAGSWIDGGFRWTRNDVASAPSLGTVGAAKRLTGRNLALPSETPTQGEAIAVVLFERIGEIPRGSEWKMHEILALWPSPVDDRGGTEFVDILTDTDGDGVGDVNERLAGTSPTDGASRPTGSSTIDVLAVYSGGFREEFGGNAYTRIHHVMAVTDALFADNGTNIRLRTVGISEVALEEDGGPSRSGVEALAERHGADLSLMFHGCEVSAYCWAPAWAVLGGSGLAGYWDGDRLEATVTGAASAIVAAHELGHNLGLAHSVRQGESTGAFRWSRGHYLDSEWGTIMTYGQRELGVFSDPGADCRGTPCGVSGTEPAGADAVRSLDLLRWQAAAHRASKPDADGDGIVDAGDALPDDPSEHVDSDGDGIGDNADGDDDNDGVADGEDAFPTDPAEWADADGDGIGDNTDDSVANLDPFRDPALRAAVEAALGKAAGASITETELGALTVLDASWAGIRDLKGLELAGNLEVLRLDGNPVADLSPLGALERLREVGLWQCRVSDLSPLANLSAIAWLNVQDNLVTDLRSLARLSGLRSLSVTGNPVSDMTPVSELSGLRNLDARSLDIADLAFLASLTELDGLDLSNNPVVDISPLSGLQKLLSVSLHNTNVADLSPLSELKLSSLDVGRTRATLEDVLALPNSRQLHSLGIARLGVEDLAWVGALPGLASLDLTGNRIVDLTPLQVLPELRSLIASGNLISDVGALGRLSGLSYVVLAHNRVSDISALARREVWDPDDASLNLIGNPLDHTALYEHIPKLEALGVEVYLSGSPAVAIPDPALRSIVSQYVAGNRVLVDDPVSEESIQRLRRLDAFNAGIADLTGLEAAAELRQVFLGSNAVSDLTPLADLPGLAVLDLSDNRISDLSPLVANPAIGAGDSIVLDGNPLSEESVNKHVPALLARGVRVQLGSVRLRARLDGGTVTFGVSGYFAALVGADASIDATSGDPDIVAAAVDGGRLLLTPVARGATAVTVTAKRTDGATATLTFLVSFVEPPRALAPVPPAALGAAGETIEFSLAELFAGDGPLTFEAQSSDPALAIVEVFAGVLTIRSLADQADGGVVTVTVTATDIGGLAATLTLEVAVDPLQRSLLQRGWFRAWLEAQRGEARVGG